MTEDLDSARLRLVILRLSRRLRRESAAGLTPTQLSALVTIERAGPLRLGDLAAHEGITPSTLTRLVTALDEGGYLIRRTDPADARSSLVTLSSDGALLLDRVRRETTQRLRERVAALSAEDRGALARALPALERLANEEGGELRTP